MSVVNCSRAEVVECSGLEQCWYEAGIRYVLIVGKSRYSRTFAAGQRLVGKKFRGRCPCQASV